MELKKSLPYEVLNVGGNCRPIGSRLLISRLYRTGPTSLSIRLPCRPCRFLHKASQDVELLCAEGVCSTLKSSLPVVSCLHAPKAAAAQRQHISSVREARR